MATTKLDHVSGKFNSLYSDLANEKQAKRMSEQEQHQQLREKIETIEASLQTEIVRRQEADRALQSHVDGELSKLSERMTGQLTEMQRSIRTGLDHLQRSVKDVHAVITEEREQRKVDIDHIGTQLCARLDEVVGAMDDERFQRLEQERQTLQRIGEDLFKISERIDCEKRCREEGLNGLASELHGFMEARGSQDEQFNTKVLDELNTLRSKLGMEVADRMQEDEAIVHAINEYTRALQEGLRIVGTQ